MNIISKREAKTIQKEAKKKDQSESGSEYLDQAEIITSIWKRRKEKKQIRWKEKAKRIINDTIKRFGVECERSLPQKSKRDSWPIKYGSYSDKDSGSIDLFSYKYEALTKNNQHTSYSQEVTKKENKMECFSESEFWRLHFWTKISIAERQHKEE